MDRYLLVFFGGGFGALMRYLAGAAIMERYSGRFPLGTVVINITGSFLIGVAMPVLAQRFHPNWRLLLVTGILGGYTTFSSFEWETHQAVTGGFPGLAILNVVASVAIGYAAVFLGSALAARL